MARQLKSFDFCTQGTRRKYPWDRWLNGKPWEFQKGKDFNGEVESFRNLARKVAYNRGLSIFTAILGSDTIVIMSILKTEERAKPKHK